MNKILLINPRLPSRLVRLNIPVSLLYVGTALSEAGYGVEIIDANNLDQEEFYCRLKDRLNDRRRRFDVVGLSVMTAQVPDAVKIAKYIKKVNPEVTIIWGGVHPTLYPEQVAESGYADYVVVGEGEEIAVRLMGVIDKGMPVEKLLVNTEPMDINKLAYPKWTLLNGYWDYGLIEMSKMTGIGLPLLSSRGCPHRCLVAGELVKMVDGTEKPVEDLQIGDKVISLNIAGYYSESCVSARLQTTASSDIIRIQTDNGRVLRCTSDHKVLTKYGWVEAGKLRRGDYIGTCGQIQDNERWNSEVCIYENQIPSLYGWEEEHPARRKRACKATIVEEQSDERSSYLGKESTITIKEQGSHQEKKTINATEQSYGKCKVKSTGEYDTKESACNIIGKGETTMGFGGTYRQTDDSKGEKNGKRKDEEIKPYEGSQSSGEDGTDIKGKNTIRPEKLSTTLVQETNRPKQERGGIGHIVESIRISFCGRWEILDRSMSKWEMQEPRFYMEEWALQNSIIVQLGILAQYIILQRYRGNPRLQFQGLAGICGNREYDERYSSGDRANNGMVSYSKINQVTYEPPTIIYDIETKPDHNFIASGIFVHNCNFCINSVQKTHYRFRDADLVIKDIEQIVNAGVDTISFWDEDFFANRKRLVDIMAGVEKKGLNFRWFGTARADYFRDGHIDAGMVAWLKKNGCRHLGIGAESGSQRVLDMIKKDITVEDTVRCAERLSEASIGADFSFMIGMPNEEPNDMFDTVKLVRQITKIDNRFRILGPFVYRPYPGSKMYEECKEAGMTEPQTLDEWADNPYIKDKVSPKDYHYYPWVRYPMNKLARIIFYCWLSGIKLRWSLLTRIGRALGALRCRYKLFGFPVELWLRDLMLKLKLDKRLSIGKFG